MPAITCPASALWPPSSHSSQPGGRRSTSGPRLRRCMRAGQTALVRPAAMARSDSPKSCSQRVAATAAAALPILMPPGQHRLGQRDRALGIAIGEAAVADLEVPLAAATPERRAQRSGARLDHRGGFRRLLRDDGGAALLQDAGLGDRDLGERVAQELHVIERDRHDDGGLRRRDHVGGVELAAEAGLQQQDVGGHAREGEEGGDGGDLEERDRIAAVGALAFLDQLDQRLLFDRARRRAGCAHGSAPGAARCRRGRACPPPPASRADRR